MERPRGIERQWARPGMLDLGFQTVDLDDPAPLTTFGFIVVTQISLSSPPSRIAR